MNELELINTISIRRTIFNKTIIKAKGKIAEREFESAAIYIQIAADYASRYHFGIFASPEIENLLKEISKVVFTKGIEPRRNKHIKKVLHIASELYATGGHTKIIQSWLSYDSTRVNDLAITNQKKSKVPKSISEYFAKNKTKILYLKDRKKSILERSKELYALSMNYDAIVLHVHPYDVIPLIAFSNSDIPVLFMNHADHRFWIGVSITNTILEIRKSGEMLSKNKRSINISNQVILPIPLFCKKIMTKEEARKNLKIGKDELVIFSVASSYKYMPEKDEGIGEILLQVLEKRNNVKAIIVGPFLSEDYWRALNKKSGGKIIPVGIKNNIDCYYVAADIYLDSYPISSLTSLLDAAKYELPILSIENGGRGLELDDLSLDTLDFKVKSINEMVAKLIFYIDNEEERKRFGAKCFEAIAKQHLNPNWASQLDIIYESALRAKKGFDVGCFYTINDYDYAIINMYGKNLTKNQEYAIPLLANLHLFPIWEKTKNILFITPKLLVSGKMIKIIINKLTKSIRK
ncbi:MAG: hypothetical protein WCF96_04930 [Eubacteriales bacterium]